MAVEDSLPGALAARAAGLACLVVPSAYTHGSPFPIGTVTVPDFTAIDATGLAALHADLVRSGATRRPEGLSADAQQIRGSCSPRGVSTTRVPPKFVVATTIRG